MASGRWRVVVRRGVRVPGLYRTPWGTLYVRFQYRGRKVSCSTGTGDVDVAMGVLHDLRLSVRQDWAGMSDGRCSLRSVAAAYLAWCGARRKRETVRTYSARIGRVLGALEGLGVTRVDELTPAVLAEYEASALAAGRGNVTINNDVGAVARMLAKGAGSLGLIDESPLRGWEPLSRRQVRPKRALTWGEFLRLLDHDHSAGGRRRAGGGARRRCGSRELWLMLGETGLRVSELAGLRWDHVDLAGGRLRVVDGKTARSRRVVGLSPDVLVMLARRLWRRGLGLRRRRRRAVGAERVFRTLGGRSVRSVVWARLRRCCAAAGIDGTGISPHSFRRSFVSWLIAAGEDPETVRAAVGHSSVKVTLEIYTETMGGSHIRAAERFGPVGPAGVGAEKYQGFLNAVGAYGGASPLWGRGLRCEG